MSWTDFFIVLGGAVGYGLLLFGVSKGADWYYARKERKRREETPDWAFQGWGGSTSITLTADPSKFKAAMAGLGEPDKGIDAVPVEKRSEPIVGWRFWSLDWQDLILKAYDDWTGPEMVARHVDRSDGVFFLAASGLRVLSPHRSPSPGCMCGINTLKADAVYPYLVENRDGAPLSVVGRVEMSGTVDEYENGYRAEKGRIIELVILAEQVGSRILDKLEERYGVRPTVQKPEDWHEEMEVIYGLGEAYQEARSGAGAAALRAARRTAGARARQDRSLSSYQDSLKAMGFQLGGPVTNYWHSPTEGDS